MNELSPPDAPVPHRASARTDWSTDRQAPASGPVKPHFPAIAVIPAALVTLFGAAAVGYLLTVSTAPVPVTTWVVLGVALVACLLTVLVGGLRGAGVGRRLTRRVAGLQAVTVRRRNEVAGLLEQVQRGERPRGFADLPATGFHDMFTALERDLSQAFRVAQGAVVEAWAHRLVNFTDQPPATTDQQLAVADQQRAADQPLEGTDQQAEVFVNLARRLQSLVHRAIQMMDDLENQVEDPDLLKGLFQVDHLVTRIRRHAENLAVLGGGGSRRRWSSPVALTEVLRSAIAEVEEYKRVKLVPPIEGLVHGHAVADVVHLVAELAENATTFSPPHTQVVLRAQTVAAGVAVEVEDRGLGIPRGDQDQMNGFLMDPNRIDRGELLRDGRLGLFVVSSLATRHRIKVRLENNIFGGTQAILVLPHALVVTPTEYREAPAQTPQRGQAPQHAQQVQDSQSVRRRPAPALPADARVAGAPAGPGRSPLSDGPPVFGTGTFDGRVAGQPAMGAPALGTPTAETPAVPVPDQAPDRGKEDTRPTLPHRSRQAHLAPELRQAPSGHQEVDAVDHNPTLAAQFMGGFRTAEEANGEGPFGPSTGTIG
jgi:signal transduction histidine kinase